MPLLERGVLLSALVATVLAGSIERADAKARVYLFRGLFDVSTGLDDLAVKLRRRGTTATVSGFAAEASVTEEAIRTYKSNGCPVVIIGHSLGADASLNMAESLRRASVPVALVVAFSPAEPRKVPSNIARVVNYYQSNSAWNYVYSAGSGFKGSLRNVNLASEASIDHFNIEKVARLHDETIRAVASLSGACKASAGRTVAPGLSKAVSPVIND